MRQYERWVLVIVTLVASAGRVHAQNAYVGGSLVTDVVRLSGLRGDTSDASGEALGGAIRLGTTLGARWGIDLEFVSTGDIESDLSVNILATQQALTRAGVTFTSIPVAPTGTTPILTIFPTPKYEVERQTSTLSAMLWAQQQFGSRAAIVYLGGVAFTRTSREDHLEFSVMRTPLAGISVLPAPVQRIENEYVFYGAGAIVGTDVHVTMTDHVRLVPGVRLQMLNAEGQNGWIIRPAVGIQWVF